MNEWTEMYMNRWTPYNLKKERLWILACDYNQYRYYSRLLKEHSLKYSIDLECRYISSPEILQGNRKGNWIRVGSWQDKRPIRDLELIFELLYVLEFKEIKHEAIERDEEERILYLEREEEVRRKYYEERAFWTIPEKLPEFITAEEMTI